MKGNDAVGLGLGKFKSDKMEWHERKGRNNDIQRAQTEQDERRQGKSIRQLIKLASCRDDY